MKVLFILIWLSTSVVTVAQDVSESVGGNRVKRTLNGSFNAVVVSDGITLYLAAGEAESISISFSDARYESRFKTVVVNGTLRISYDNDGINWNDNKKRKLKAYVSYKMLNKLSATGGSDVILTTPLKVSDLELKFTSGTRLTGDIHCTNMFVSQHSGSEINVEGAADKITLEAASGATFKGYDLLANYCNAKATTGAIIRIKVNKELKAKANSGGVIHYKGSGAITEVNVQTGGAVKKSQ